MAPPRKVVPPEFRVVLSYDPNIYLVTGAGTLVIGEGGTYWIGEHPILQRELTALAATTEFLVQTEGVPETEELRLQAGKLAKDLAKRIETEVVRSAKQAA